MNLCRRALSVFVTFDKNAKGMIESNP